MQRNVVVSPTAASRARGFEIRDRAVYENSEAAGGQALGGRDCLEKKIKIDELENLFNRR